MPSLFFKPPTLTDAITSPPLPRLNSRGRIRTMLAAEVENGIVINPSVFMPGPNPSRDSTQGGTGPVIDIVAGFTDRNTVETSWQKVRPL